MSDEPDLLAALQEQLNKTQLAIAAAKRKETMATRQRSTGLTEGARVRTNTPRSERFHNREGVVIGRANLGEIGVGFGKNGGALAAYFLPTELIKL